MTKEKFINLCEFNRLIVRLIKQKKKMKTEKECIICHKKHFGMSYKYCSLNCKNYAYKKRNIDKEKIWRQRYREKHREEIKKHYQKYYQENKEKLKQNHRRWYQKNRERVINKTKRWRKENPEKFKISMKKSKEKNKIKELSKGEENGI